MTLVLSEPDVDWRHLVFEAAYSKGLHVWMAKRSSLISGTKAGQEGILDRGEVRAIKQTTIIADLGGGVMGGR
jgi:hypothetical protein